MRLDLRRMLKERLLVGDGAMGTYLYQLGVPVGSCLEELNITRPELVERAHRDYLLAGAHLLETNTFAANRERLARHGLAEKVLEVNQAAVERARQAVKQVKAGWRDEKNERPVFVLGALGGIRGGKRSGLSDYGLEEVYKEQMAALLEAGVDGLMLETFVEMAELRLAVKVARKLDDAISVFAQLSVKESGRTEEGLTLSESLAMLRDEGADVVGLNCYSGPYTMIRLLEQTAFPQDLLLSVYPNAGLPEYQDGQFIYPSSAAYFAERALDLWRLGVRVIGGCCGTTPEHIAAISRVLAERALQPVARQTAQVSEEERMAKTDIDGLSRSLARDSLPIINDWSDANPLDDPTSDSISQRHAAGLSFSPTLPELARQRHALIVELDPPRDLDISRFMEGAAALKEAGIDALTMADNSLAMTRMSNMALGAIVKERLGTRPLLHIACRDRNWIGQQSHLMGLHALGIDHVLAVTGDPTRHGDLPGAASVYDGNSFDLIRMIKQLNAGLAFSGQPLKYRARFTVAAAFNPNVRNLDKAMERLERKVACGADFIMTQPIYDPVLFERLYERTRHLPVPIFVGIMPLVSYRNALFLHNEVPGIQLPETVLERMSRFEGEAARQQGVEIAMELLDVAMTYFNGIYLMTPFLRYEMTVELARHVWRRSRQMAMDGRASMG